MNYAVLLTFFAATLARASAFIPSYHNNAFQHKTALMSATVLFAASASPEQEQTATDALKERTRGLLDMTLSMMAEGVPMPSSSAALEAAYTEGNYNQLMLQFVVFFVDMKLNYDVGEDDGVCRPTVHPCTDPDDEVTQEKLPQLYQFCHSVIADAEPELKLAVWKIVVDELAARVNMDNRSFNDWCVKALTQ